MYLHEPKLSPWDLGYFHFVLEAISSHKILPPFFFPPDNMKVTMNSNTLEMRVANSEHPA